ncbi:MAG: hypothetical protein UW70_C0040G0003 [Candidatus Peregrinibacteria bacterium GW2011_GWA2_44_7]|nr:MAG: hypothetical protein UW70_C0040G0003 [Candidatus Peregrinibacteria bacterium GW2011_GWA2_44_7]
MGHGDRSSEQDLATNPEPDLGLKKLTQKDLLKIQEVDGNIFLRNRIDLLGMEPRLYKLYHADPRLKTLNLGLKSIAETVAYCIRSIRFFLIDEPDKDELAGTIARLQEILSGKYFSEDSAAVGNLEDYMVNLSFVDKSSIAIPNILQVGEAHYPLFASFDGIERVVDNALPFLKESEIRKISLKINSHSTDLKEKALKAKEIIEHYLKEARDLIDHTDTPLPEYYNPASEVTGTINRIRKSILY